MAAYATRAEMNSLSLPSSALSPISTSDQDAALEAASRVADSFLVKRFQLPLTGWGVDIKQAVCDMAAYRLMRMRGFSPERSDADQMRLGFEDAMKWLDKVGNGSVTPIDLVDAGSGASNTDAAGEAQRASAAQVLQPDSCGNVQTPKTRGW